MDATVEQLPNPNSRTRIRLTQAVDTLTGVSCGVYLTAFLHQALGLGSSAVNLTAIQAVVLFAIVAGVWTLRKTRRLTHFNWTSDAATASHAGTWSFGVLHLALVILAVFPDAMIEPAWFVSDSLANEGLFDAQLLQGLVALASLSAGWLVPVMLVVMLSGTHRSPGTIAVTWPPSRLAMLSLGVLFAVFIPGVIGGSTLTASVGALMSCAAVGLSAFHQFSDRSDVAVSNVEHPHAPTSGSSDTTDFTSTTGVLAGSLACGVLFASMRRLLDQLFLDTAWLSSVEWAAVVMGFAVGVWLVQARAAWRTRLPLFAAGFCLLLLTLFPVWVEMALELKATVSVALVAMSLKAIAATCAVLPAGGALGAITGTGKSRTQQCFAAALFCAGLWGANWLLVPGIGLAGAAVVSIGVLAIVGMSLKSSSPDSESPALRSHWISRNTIGAVVATLLLCMGSTWGIRNYDPALSAKLLFDSRVFTTSRTAMRFDLLPYLSDDRCLQIVETQDRTLTLWQTRGSQLRIRESGVPVGITGTAPDIGPQLSAESLQAILPLSLHERPSKLLLTGLGSGAVLQTSLHFPLTSIDCIDSDPALITAVSDHVLSRVVPSPLDDGRVSIRCCEPALALRALADEYDVILCRPSQPVLTRASAESTVEFLKLASRCLADDGLCAQPLDIVDFGPVAVRSFVQTWQAAFTQVGAIEIAPGRLLLIGANTDSGVFREGFIDRLQHPHVRFALAETGWDWATPLQLASWSPEALTELYSGQARTISGISNMSLTSWLPWEVSRWGDKYAQASKELATGSHQLQAQAGFAGQSADILDRLTELREQRDLIRHEPDQYWAYRNVTRRLLKESPRSELVQVKGEEPVHRRHPEDKQRLKYFRLLGEAAKRTTAENLLAVADLETPYDPLVTFFLHQEVAELASRDREALADIELRHRLHRAHFTSPGDHSVRNVIAAIELLCDHVPEDIDPVWRGDHLDALMQVLHERWTSRGDVQPDSSRVVLVDIEKSIAAMERAFQVMPTLTEARGFTIEDWAARKLVLEKLLVRPLRTYRTMLLPHHEREQRRSTRS